MGSCYSIVRPVEVRGWPRLMLTHARRSRCTADVKFVRDRHHFASLIYQVYPNCVDDFVIQTTYFSRVLFLSGPIFDNIAVTTPSAQKVPIEKRFNKTFFPANFCGLLNSHCINYLFNIDLEECPVMGTNRDVSKANLTAVLFAFYKNLI